MKKLILGICLLASNAFAGPGEAVQDQTLFDTLSTRYNGEWTDNMDSSVMGETLKDGSMLIELRDRFAEFAFYNVPKAKEDFQYIPSVGGAGWLNYFDRTGNSIKCGESSFDLKKNPFPNFKCRLSVDADGNVKAFGDRSSATSNAKPGGYSGWEDGTIDFHWRALTELNGTADSYSNSGVRPNSSNKESFHLQIFGEIALVLYNKLTAKSDIIYWGPDQPVEIKQGNQIWCLSADKGQSAKCRIAYGFDGTAQAPDHIN